MKRFALSLGCMIVAIAGCSLAPERPVSKVQLFDSGIYNVYTIRDSPDSVLAALNKEGEVVLKVKYKDQPYYVKLLATNRGLVVSVIDR